MAIKLMNTFEIEIRKYQEPTETHFTIPFIYILINGVRLTKLSGLFRNGPLLACLDRTIHSVEGIAYGPFN